MIGKKRKKNNSRGFVLPLITALIVILAFTGVGLLNLGQHARLRSITTTADIRARAAADAGLVQVIHLLNKKVDDDTIWNNDELPTMTDIALPNSSETFSFTVTGTPSSFNIVSTGESVNAQRKVYSTTMLKSVFNFAVAVQKNLSLYPNSAVTGYNSKSGKKDLKIQIGTNSVGDDSVIVMNGSSVNGDVYVGVGGDPANVIRSKGTITGETRDMPQEIYFPPVSPPESLFYKGFIKQSVTIIPFRSGEYSYINLGNSEVITVDGGDVVLYVTGDVDLGNGAEIVIKAGSSLDVYIDGDWISKEGAEITNEHGLASHFNLFGTGEPGQIIELKAKNEFYGTVYAPDASVGIKAGGDIFGSFVSNDFELKSKSTVYYDTELAEVNIDDIGIYFTVNSWREE
ncbi:hypothetical protein ACFL1G_01855 [Planctomycetota bacterium]